MNTLDYLGLKNNFHFFEVYTGGSKADEGVKIIDSGFVPIKTRPQQTRWASKNAIAHAFLPIFEDR